MNRLDLDIHNSISDRVTLLLYCFQVNSTDDVIMNVCKYFIESRESVITNIIFKLTQ